MHSLTLLSIPCIPYLALISNLFRIIADIILIRYAITLIANAAMTGGVTNQSVRVYKSLQSVECSHHIAMANTS